MEGKQKILLWTGLCRKDTLLKHHYFGREVNYPLQSLFIGLFRKLHTRCWVLTHKAELDALHVMTLVIWQLPFCLKIVCQLMLLGLWW